MSVQETFIRNLKQYRKKKGLTQTELTVEINMGLNYINGVEQGAFFPKPDVIDRIAQVLNIKPSQLFDELSGRREILAVNTDSMVERITDRLIQKMRPSIHDDIAEILRELVN